MKKHLLVYLLSTAVASAQEISTTKIADSIHMIRMTVRRRRSRWAKLTTK